MALQKGKQFNFSAVLMALAGGSAGAFVQDLAEDNIKIFRKNPVLGAMLPAIVGSGILYFMDDKYKPLAYGMLGNSGASVVDETGLINGFSRVNNILPQNMQPKMPIPQPMAENMDGMIEDYTEVEQDLI